MQQINNVEDQVISEDPEVAEAFAEHLVAAMQTFYGHELGVSGCVLWVGAMKGVCTIREFREALNDYVKESRNGARMPRPIPADILVRVGSGAGTEAWKKALYMVKHFGATHSIEFDDPKIGVVIARMGGWPEFCRKFDKTWDNSREDDVMREFHTHYSGVKSNAPPHALIGVYGRNSHLVRMKNKMGHLTVARMPLLENKE